MILFKGDRYSNPVMWEQIWCDELGKAGFTLNNTQNCMLSITGNWPAISINLMSFPNISEPFYEKQLNKSRSNCHKGRYPN
jgi:hypothetical protein